MIRTGASRWWLGQWHPVDHEGLKALPQALQLGLGHAGPGSARIDEPAFRCEVAQELPETQIPPGSAAIIHRRSAPSHTALLGDVGPGRIIQAIDLVHL